MVGHTVISTNIKLLCKNKIISIDLKHPNKKQEGKVKALRKDASV